ncbi:MAG: chemotaxis protein CheA [Acidobacteriia bacterium]|nr:chemotaxis protein CheA [Terriglobia bacterium]
MQIDLSRFRETFFQEAAEHLAEMEAGLLRLEQNSFDPELLNAIFRAAHSIKGAAGMFGLEDVARFTHALESLLDGMRAGTITVTPEHSDVLLRANDVLRELLAAAADGTASPARMEAVLGELYVAQRSSPERADSPGRVREQDRKSGRRQYRVHFRPAAEIFAQGMDPLLVLRDLAQIGEPAEVEIDLASLPALASLDPEQCHLAWNVRVLTGKTEQEIRDIFAFVEDGAEIRIQVESAGTEPAAAPVATPAAAAQQTPANAREASIRVATSKVDKLIDLVGELVIAQSMAKEIADHFSTPRLSQLQEAVAVMERHIRELQERVMSVRMLPIGHIFGRFPRLVRDVSVQLGKDVRLQIAGEDTELDKSVVEQMGDPLTHLIRNAIDHGIESPEDRRRSGKPEQGLIRLAASHQAGSVIVEVSDDGGGLDTDAIRRKALERGLIGASDSLSEDQVRELIFAPGFSTAPAVSDLSGRGVGMDVVKRNVAALNGSVSLASEPGRGTTVRISLPLTLAILDGLLLKVGSETYVLPLVAIVESIRPAAGQVRLVAGRGEVALVRGEALPLLRLHGLFGIPTQVQDPCQGLTVIIEHGGQRFALLVDELLGQQQVVIKSLEANYRKVEGVLGATILGDGRAALILDVGGLSQVARRAGSVGLAA